MHQKQINRIIKLLKDEDVSFEKGLSDKEVETIEQTFDFIFPEDLKRFLQTALPVSGSFANWRYAINNEKGRQRIINRFCWPLEGMLFDIRNNDFWLDQWGEKPKDFADQKVTAAEELAKQPKLIPIYSHRYMPAEPTTSGNPVFSVYQMDIIHYGVDLADYLANEFRFELPGSFGRIANPIRIRFWSDMIDRNNAPFV